MGTILIIVAVVALVGALAYALVMRSMAHQMLHALRRPIPIEPASGPATADLQARQREVEVAGFELVAERDVTIDIDRQRLHLSWRDDGTFVELSQRASGDGPVKVAVMTTLDPGGVLTTQDVYGAYTVPAELKQVFSDADVAQLVREHDRTLAWLAREGFRPQRFERDQVVERYRQIVQWIGREHPRSTLLFYRLARAETHGRVFGDEGSIIDAPSTAAKLTRLRQQPAGPFVT